MKTVLALDFGTSSLKAGLIDVSGTLLREGIYVFAQVPDYGNWQTNQWLDALKLLFSDIFGLGKHSDMPVPDAIVISGNGPTLVAMGSNYADNRHASWPVLLWMTAPDSRIDGQKSFYLPKLAWLRDNNPALFEKGRLFMSGPEYLSWTLCGVESTILPQEQFRGYIWDEQGFEAYHLDPGRFPDYVGVGEIIGRVDRRGAELSGLPVGIPVIAGGSDFMMSLLGTGVIESGLTCDRAGTSEGINFCADSPVHNEALRTLPHIVPGLYNVAGILSGTGRMFEWFRTFSHQRDVSYLEMMDRISAASNSSSAPWFFPSVHRDSCWDFKGGMFAGLQPEHSSADLGRAVVYAIGFSIRSALEYLGQSGCTVTAMRSCGGQAKNSLWCQMKSDLTNIPIEVPAIADAELTGCAILGFMGLKEYTHYQDATKNMLRIAARYEPNPRLAHTYGEVFVAWDESYAYIRDVAEHLPHIIKE